MSTSVRQELRDYTVLAGEGKGEEEYLITRLECYSPPLTIVNSYGEQEKVGKEEQEERWGRLRKELEGPGLQISSIRSLTWKMSETLPEQDCSFPDFTRKCANYVNLKSQQNSVI